MTRVNGRERVDLHTHTIASDGRWSPQQLLQQIQSLGIDCFAVTDHDSIASVAETEMLAHDSGLEFLRGVEVSTKHAGRLMHVLAYGFDLQDNAFGTFLRENEALLNDYDDELIAKLIDAGYRLDLRAYEVYDWDRQRGGWKSLNFLIDQGLCRDVHSFFNELFVGDLEATFPDFPSPADVIPLIRKAGGVPVWAHPATSLSMRAPFAAQDDERIVAEMVAAGVAGLECYTCHHDAHWTNRCLAWADGYDLLITGGSDSHGGFAGRQLGVPVIQLDDLRLGPLCACFG